MTTYKAILRQEGGCDYSIGCGISIIDLTADTWNDAIDELKDYLKENHSRYVEVRLENVTLLELTDSKEIDMERFYKEYDEEVEAEKQKQKAIKKEKRDKREYERLKAKFENE